MSEPSLHSAAHVVQQALIALGLAAAPVSSGSQPDWPCYVESEPDQPDNVITVYTTTDVDHGRTSPDRERQVHYGVQIRLRAATYAVGYPKARALALALDNAYQTSVVLGGTTYTLHSFNRSGGVVSLGPEPLSHRNLFVINLTTSIQASA